MRIVLDTMVFFRSLIRPAGVSGQILFDHAHRFRLVVSEPIVLEILDVLHRPELRARFPHIGDIRVGGIIERLGNAEVVDPVSVPRISRDPKDDKFLATAAAAQVDYLVSDDNDLLVIGSYAGVRIITPRQLLTILATQQ
jgi:putative PIN family toxin of toxin-antitoxin system